MATALIFEPGEMGNKNSSKRSRPLNQVVKIYHHLSITANTIITVGLEPKANTSTKQEYDAKQS
jgi:hypothetical protein